jgi:hypothetical protein
VTAVLVHLFDGDREFPNEIVKHTGHVSHTVKVAVYVNNELARVSEDQMCRQGKDIHNEINDVVSDQQCQQRHPPH